MNTKIFKKTALEKMFTENLDDLFDMAHTDALEMIKDEDVRQFLNSQRQKGSVSCLLRVEMKKQAAEEKRQLHLQQETARQEKALSESLRANGKMNRNPHFT